MVVNADWKEVRLGEHASMRSGGTPLTSVASFYGGTIPWASISDMSASGKYLGATDRYITEAGLASSPAVVFPEGVLLYAMYASIGECCISVCPMATSQAILGIKCASSLNLEFLYYTMQSKRSEIARSGQQGTQANLNAQMVRETLFRLPPLKEQEAIAEALNDADAAIESLDALIAKKRDVKQATMQQLLTGRTRLPGFTAEWKKVRFDEVFARVNISNRKLQTSEYSDIGRLPVMDQGQTRIAGFTDRQDIELIPPRDGFVIFGDHTRIVKHVRHPFVAGADGVQILRSCEGFNAEFLSLLLSSSRIPNTGYNRHFKFLKELIFKVPSDLVEQEAIAEALSVMGDELEALTAQVSKLRMVKEGMMQDLLTGKVRLV